MSDDRPRLVVTGPSGWIGTAFLAALARTRGPFWSQTVSLFGATARRIVAPDGSEVQVHSLDRLAGADVADSHVIHLAYLTKDKVKALGAPEFLSTNMAIDERVLAACRSGKPRAIFIASSGAAREAENGRGEPYGISKLLQENRFISFGEEARLPVFVGRIYNLGGPFINKLNAYALSSMLAEAFNTGFVHIEAKSPVYRAYLHVDDLCALVLGWFESDVGTAGPQDLSGSLIVEMQDVAREALRVAGRPNGGITRGLIDWERPSAYFGDPTAARGLALRLGLRLRSFAEQVEDTATDLSARGVLLAAPGQGDGLVVDAVNLTE